MEDPISKHMTLGEHLEELRTRLIYILSALFGTLIVCLIDQQFYMKIVLAPHNHVMESLHLPSGVQVLNYEESFFSHLKVSVIVALIITMPYTIHQLWLFVSAGLYKSEKKYFKLFFPFALGCFLLGVIFGYCVLIPMGLRFLASYGISDIRVGFTLSSYISLFFVLTFVCGLMFELPILMLLLVKINIFSSQDYINKWRYFILTAFIVAALLTPPDAVTQILMAGPMILLYLFGIFICRLAERMNEIHRFFLDHE